MGIFNSFGALSGQFAARQERSQVTKALIEELQTPGKLAEVLHSLKNNGLGSLVQQWSEGQTASTSAAQMQQGLKTSNLAEALMKKTNMPIGVVGSSLAILLPLAIARLTLAGCIKDGQASDPSSIHASELADALA